MRLNSDHVQNCQYPKRTSNFQCRDFFCMLFSHLIFQINKNEAFRIHTCSPHSFIVMSFSQLESGSIFRITSIPQSSKRIFSQILNMPVLGYITHSTQLEPESIFIYVDWSYSCLDSSSTLSIPHLSPLGLLTLKNSLDK